MKVRVSTKKLDGRFDEVARLIAKGDPPPWLIVGLQHFSDGIGVEFTGDDRRSFEKTVEQMQSSIDYLMKKLPMYVLAAYGEECPEPVTLALYVLPQLRAELDLLPEDGTGRRPDRSTTRTGSTDRGPSPDNLSATCGPYPVITPRAADRAT